MHHFVEEVLQDGKKALEYFINQLTDQELGIDSKGEKGKGYILYRLQLHTMVHANQMAFMRSTLDPNWEFGSHFGDMATAVISTSYSTHQDLKIGGF